MHILFSKINFKNMYFRNTFSKYLLNFKNYAVFNGNKFLKSIFRSFREIVLELYLQN